MNASRSPKFLGQPAARATRSTEVVDPRCWVVVAPVTSIPAEALQSKRPMPKTRHACVRQNFHSLEVPLIAWTRVQFHEIRPEILLTLVRPASEDRLVFGKNPSYLRAIS